MCGIAGFFCPRLPLNPDQAHHQVAAMAEAIRHRGPDAQGVWVDAEAGIALGHRRLSILDLSPAGAQPMASQDGRHVIVYNGEIYNFSDLRRDLEACGVTLRGGSDTEVLLEAIARQGLAATLPRLAGMYAFALWDRRDRVLTLVRDPLGIKPLYWGLGHDGTILFGSELKALRAHPAWNFQVDPQAVAALLAHGYVPAPLSIHRGVQKLPPGHSLAIDAGGRHALRQFWSLADTARNGQAQPLVMSDGEATEALDALLKNIVAEHLAADVPVGAFLSGGIDSSAVAAAMTAASSTPVRTFSIGYDDAVFNETAHAAAVARHLGTDHTELRVTPADALAVIPSLPDIYDEPFADSSQIPTCLVSRLARAHVTVALSGDGGDELFAGYNRHVWTDRVQGGLRGIPAPLRRLAAGAMVALPVETWDRVLGHLPGMPRMPGNKMHKLAAALKSDAGDIAALYRQFITLWPEAHRLVSGATPPTPSAPPAGLGSVEQMQALDYLTYLPDDILVKTDRASMAVGLEARVPLLDRRLAEFAWRLPRPLRLRGGQGKWLLRQVLYRHVPRALVDRPKMGFAVPIGAWLRGPLRGWAEDLLAPPSLAAHGLLDPEPIRRRWEEHLAGRGNWDQHLWAVLMFQAWWRRWEAPSATVCA